MKNYKINSHILLLSLGCMLLLRWQPANAQVAKAMKYAWFFDYERAEKFLTNAKNEPNDTMIVQLAEVLYQQGKYPQALYYYKIADKKGAIQTQQARRNYVFASTMMREKSPYYKKSNYFKSNYFLYTVIDTFAGNSTNEDISSFYWNEMLFVTTSRRTISNEKAFHAVYTKMPFLDVYPFTEKGKQLRYPSYLPKTINTAANDGPIAISADTNLIVLTRNYSKANSKDVQNLYLTYYLRDSKKKWSKALSFNFIKPGFSAQHPFYNEAEKLLYFSSDMPGGSGGYDLYKTRWNGTQWTPPVNLGPEVNSEFDEVFPAFSPDGELLYASNHIETTGGLDIVLFSNNTRYLLNEPFNTIYDDFGLIFKSQKEGYFSSNRFSNKFDDNIYHFTLSEPEKQTMYVKAYDAESGVEMDQVSVVVASTDGSYLREVITKTGGDNIGISDTADARKVMHFSATKAGYLNYDVINNEYFIKEGKLVKEIFLQKSPIYAADDYFVIENNNRSSKFPGLLANDSLLGSAVQENDVHLHLLNNPLEGFMKVDMEDGKVKIASGASPGKYNFNYAICSQKSPGLCDTAEVVIIVRAIFDEEKRAANVASDIDLDEPEVRVINDTGFTTVNGGYIMNVRNNDRVKGRKASPLNSVIRNERSDHPDLTLNRRTGAVTLKKGVPSGTYHLYYDLNPRGDKGKMEQATVTIVVRNRDQIPAKGSMGDMQVKSDENALYFHNDEPNGFQIFRPAFTYQNSYESYLKQRNAFYEKSADSKPSLDSFFVKHVEAGYDEVNTALELIQSRLNQGVQVEILVTAYCSPIATAAYNNKLSNRRLLSVIRYLKKWNEGALWDAIESNRIIFWEHAVGDLEASKDISYDYNKLNESVFGIKASLERRVNLTVKIMGAN
ncbi:MAG: PD40 domain-containing protein [Bacteroidia bacterium]|nr:PD40 domain-containing protein [Bacteroidia bacterium]